MSKCFMAVLPQGSVFFFLKVLFSLLVSPLNSSDVAQMAIDWLTKNFYFVDDVDDRVFVCNKNGQTCVTLLDQELYNPKGIALDPAMGSVLPSSVPDLALPSGVFFILATLGEKCCLMIRRPADQAGSQKSSSKCKPRQIPHTHIHVGSDADRLVSALFPFPKYHFSVSFYCPGKILTYTDICT